MSQVDHMKPLTVKELIEILKEFPQDAIVYSEGCDCTEEACYVDFLIGWPSGKKSTDKVEICREYDESRKSGSSGS